MSDFEVIEQQIAVLSSPANYSLAQLPTGSEIADTMTRLLAVARAADDCILHGSGTPERYAGLVTKLEQALTELKKGGE